MGQFRARFEGHQAGAGLFEFGQLGAQRILLTLLEYASFCAAAKWGAVLSDPGCI